MIPILLIVVIVFLVFRGRRGSTVDPGVGISGRDPVRMILLIVVVLLLIGVLVSLFAPLGDYRFWSR
jgi:hypothetical protein